MTIPTVITISPDRIAPNPWQTRQTIDPAGIETLADSIDRDGLLQPILVRSIRRDRYELVAGQRRLEAWKLLEERGRDMGGILAMVREIDDRQMILDTLTENLVREDVDPIEETRAMARAIEEIEELTQAHLAELLGVSSGQVSNRLRLLRLPDSVLQTVTSGRMAWTTARELLALVGDDHVHEEEIAIVIDNLPSYKDRVTGHDVRTAIAEVASKKPARWRPLEDLDSWFSNFAVGKNPPLFDVEAFKELHAAQVHRLPKHRGSGYFVWTCAGKDWQVAQREAKAEQKIEEPPDPLREAWADAMAKDQVAQRLGLDREKFSTENSLTEEEVKALGTRGRFVKAGPGRSISGTAHNTPPKFFDKNECFSKCITGAVYAPSGYYGVDKPALKCGNQKCYDRKYGEGLDRFKVKEGKNAERIEAARVKLAAQLRPVLVDRPGLARRLLQVMVDGRVISGQPTRPLGYSDGGTETRYHAPASVRLAHALGFSESDVTDREEEHALWLSNEASEQIAKVEDPVPAAVEALSIALEDGRHECG